MFCDTGRVAGTMLFHLQKHVANVGRTDPAHVDAARREYYTLKALVLCHFPPEMLPVEDA